MYKINRLKVGGFRRLHKVDLTVKPLMVLIGANGVGKSSLLDAFSLLSASARGKLKEGLSSMGGVADVLTRGKADSLSLHVDMAVPDQRPYEVVPGQEPFEYDISLTPKGAGYAISHEVLSQDWEEYDLPFNHIDSSADAPPRYFDVKEKHLVEPNWEHDPLETSLSQVPKMFQQPEELRKILASTTQYHVLDVGPRAPVKLPQQMKPAELPGTDGEDLVALLYSLRESDHDRYEAIVDSLRAAFPDFDGLSFPPVAAGMLAMTWKDKNFAKPLYMHELSEGTLRFLWLVSLLQSPGLSTITMIDEPEVSLHPELLSLLAELMREASERTQLIVATHSDRLVRFLRPEEVVVMDIGEDGGATATWADTLDLDEWLADYSFDEVWRMGRMGGRS